MKKRLLFYLMFFGTILNCSRALGQQDALLEETYFGGGDPVAYTASPQTWAFTRYGATPVNYYTGTATVDVPIYSYKDNDFEVNVSAGYASNGFQPQRQTGILGMNWFLNCGGSVTREIRGVADDQHGGIYFRGNNPRSGASGFMLGSATYSDSDALNLTNVYWDFPYGTPNRGGYELDADIFHFNFMGHSGTFHLNGEHKICVYNTGGNHGTYDIELYPQVGDPKLSGGGLRRITIRTGDGYTYVFGGYGPFSENDEPYFERRLKTSLMPNDVYYIGGPLESHPIVTWFLREVTAPNGRTIKFTYETQIGDYSYASDNPHLVVNLEMGEQVLERIPGPEGGSRIDRIKVDQDGVPFLENPNLCRQPGAVRTSYLKDINIGSGGDILKIEFNYSKKAVRDMGHGGLGNTARTIAEIAKYTKQLNSIVVKSQSGSSVDIIRQGIFTYIQQDDRLILDNIEVPGVGHYRMSYYEAPGGFAPLWTSAVDFWGYYNGRNSNESYQINPAVLNSGFIIKPWRNPDWEYAVGGCLKRIVYPTNGYTEFEYESNRAGYIISYSHPSGEAGIQGGPGQQMSPVPVYVYDGKTCGGVRIKRIIDSDGAGNSQWREFKYENGMMTFPNFYSYAIRLLTEEDTGTLIGYKFIGSVTTSGSMEPRSLDQSHIGYQTVREVSSDGSYVEYSFCNNADDQLGQVGKPGTIYNTYITGFTSEYNRILRKYNSRHYQRGKLIGQAYYDKNGQKVRSEQMTYADHDEGRNFTVYAVISGQFYWSVKKYTSDFRMTNKVVTDYFAGNFLSVTTEYTYNALGQVASVTQTRPDGFKDRTDMKFLYQQTGWSHAPVNYPYEVIATRIDPAVSGMSGYVRDAAHYSYVNINSKPKPKVVSKLSTEEPIAFTLGLPALIYAPKIYYDFYDSMGNPVQIRDASGVVTSYLWGYGGLYPVVKVVGATYDQIRAKLGISGNTPLPGGLTTGQSNTLRTQLSNALVDTYVYKRHVGMTSHTGPLGQTETFEYDSYGRLKRTSDSMGEVQQYEYHLQTVN